MSDAKLAHDSSELARRYDQISADRQFRSGKALIAELGIDPATAYSTSAAGPDCWPNM